MDVAATPHTLIYFLMLSCGVVVGFLIRYWTTRHVQGRLEELALDERESKTRLETLHKEHEALKQNLAQEINLSRDLHSSLRAKEVELEQAHRELSKTWSQAEERQEQLKKEFELLSNRIIQEKGKQLMEDNTKSLAEVLRPFKDRMLELQERVEKTHLENSKDRSGLKEKINELHKVYLTLSDDTKSLTNALRSDVKQQGNWGELVLERVLESSNLRAGEEYEKQYSTTGDEGQRLQPDFVIHLPDGKHLIIDSKVSLKHYEIFINSEEIPDREAALKAHLLSVKNHIKGLSEKNYQSANSIKSPDFVLMFLPIEASFALAVQTDKDLFEYAWKRKVVIVSPSTLLATLRTIASLWQMERQNRNAEEIARQAGGLYEKFNGLLDSIHDIGKHLEKGQQAYALAYNRLAAGKGNLVGRVKKLGDMGADIKKAKEIDMEEVDRELQRVGNPKEESHTWS